MRLVRRLALWAVAAAVVVVGYNQWRARPMQSPLPGLGLELAGTTVSGLSSGAYMAGQMQIALSRTVAGAGLVAGGPYACADSPTARALPWPASVPQNLARALSRCLGAAPGLPDVAGLVERAKSLAASGDIDPLEEVARHRVYLFTGGADRTVGQPVVAAARDFYRRAGVPAETLAFIEDPRAGHAFLTESVGTACGTTRPPFVNDCDYDQAGAILDHLLGGLAPPSRRPAGNLIRFDQRPFTRGLGPHGLDSDGFAYVPDACRAGRGCRLHVVFHGCGQSRAAVGDRFVKASGYAPHADANRLVVLFPQVAPSTANPEGCWDWWGYSARNFLTRSAPQIAAVWRMAERLAQPE